MKVKKKEKNKMAYQTTQVPVGRSQEQIRQLLLKFGVAGVSFSDNFEQRQINVRFAKKIKGNLRTVNVTMTLPEPPKLKRPRTSYIRQTRRGLSSVSMSSEEKRKEQMARATYRALHDWLKAQFVAVEYGLLTFEDVFLSHFEWMIGNQTTTIGALIKPKLELPQLESGNIDGDVIEGKVKEDESEENENN